VGHIWDSIRRASAPRDDADRLSAFKHAHGKDASRHLAEHFGVSRRQAQRWIKEGRITKAGERAEELDALVTDEMAAADALANASGIDFGHVDVTYGKTGKSEGVRKVGFFSLREPVTAVVRQAMQSMEAGDHETGEDLMAQAALMAYCMNVGEEPHYLSKALYVSNFRTGFHIV